MSMIINPYRFAGGGGGGGGGDPYWANVVLLLHCDGTDGSTSFADSSGSAHTMSVTGNAEIDTAEKKFGTASGLWSAAVTNSRVKAAASSDFNFGTGAWTFEAWLWFNSSARQYVADFATLNTSAIVITPSNGKVEVYSGVSGFLINSITSAIATGQWHYFAVVRNGTSITAWLNGTQIASNTISAGATWGSGLVDLTLGGAGASFAANNFSGQMDDIRYTKGVARDVSNVPTSAFPDS